MNRAGYSLLEIIIVLAVMGVLAIAAVPALGVWSPRPTSADTEIISLLNSTRKAALSTAQEVTLVIDPSTGTWVAGHASFPTSSGTLDLSSATIISDHARIVITMTPTGGVIGGDLTVRLKDHFIRVHADRWTGKVATTDA